MTFQHVSTHSCRPCSSAHTCSVEWYDATKESLRWCHNSGHPWKCSSQSSAALVAACGTQQSWALKKTDRLTDLYESGIDKSHQLTLCEHVGPGNIDDTSGTFNLGQTQCMEIMKAALSVARRTQKSQCHTPSVFFRINQLLELSLNWARLRKVPSRSQSMDHRRTSAAPECSPTWSHLEPIAL